MLRSVFDVARDHTGLALGQIRLRRTIDVGGVPRDLVWWERDLERAPEAVLDDWGYAESGGLIDVDEVRGVIEE